MCVCAIHYGHYYLYVALCLAFGVVQGHDGLEATIESYICLNLIRIGRCFCAIATSIVRGPGFSWQALANIYFTFARRSWSHSRHSALEEDETFGREKHEQAWVKSASWQWQWQWRGTNWIDLYRTFRLFHIFMIIDVDNRPQEKSMVCLYLSDLSDARNYRNRVTSAESFWIPILQTRMGLTFTFTCDDSYIFLRL